MSRPLSNEEIIALRQAGEAAKAGVIRISFKMICVSAGVPFPNTEDPHPLEFSKACDAVRAEIQRLRKKCGEAE